MTTSIKTNKSKN